MGAESVFDCQGCGHCCEGKGGIIVAPKDLQRLCLHLAISPEEFEQQWAERKGLKLVIKPAEDGFCVFYKPGIGCGVHVAKPDVCRAWPFFRGNLVDPTSLELAKDYCPGIKHTASFNEFVIQGLAYLEENNLGSSGGASEGNALRFSDILRPERS